jgi:DNA recombination-dependent growth factor C
VRRGDMGILFNTVSICQFKVVGDRPSKDLYEWVSDRLGRNSFRSIDNTIDQVSSGWVHLDDSSRNSFNSPRAFWRDPYLAFTLRRDQRRIPSVLFRAYLRKAESEFLAAHPGMRRVPKQKREELSQAVLAALYAKTLPVPSTYDAVWDTRSGLVTFTSLSPKAIDLFENHFKNTFDGLRLVMLHPFSRGERVLKDKFRPSLLKANRAATGDVLNLIQGNQWLGWDFLLWLTYQTTNQTSEYTVNQAGPGQEGETFVAYLNDRLVLLGGGEGSLQRVSVVGSQEQFSEVRAALKSGKQITEATLTFEKEENQWKMTLRSLMFHFASFKSPSVQIEKDNTTHEADEKEAVFYERMSLLEEGLQLFDSLYAAFLEIRLGKTWAGEEKNIRKWLASD